jgi:hypothetical protein
MSNKNGFIVIQCLFAGFQPVFREDEDLIFFDTEAEAQAEIQDCIDGTTEAVKLGHMAKGHEMKQDDYRIIPANLEGTTITCEIDREQYTMDVKDEDFVEN